MLNRVGGSYFFFIKICKCLGCAEERFDCLYAALQIHSHVTDK